MTQPLQSEHLTNQDCPKEYLLCWLVMVFRVHELCGPKLLGCTYTIHVHLITYSGAGSVIIGTYMYL